MSVRSCSIYFIRKGDEVKEIIVGVMMGIDVLAIYVLLPFVKRKLLLSIWTAVLHMLFPLLGYMVGDMLYNLLEQAASVLSIILLFCIGLQFLLTDDDNDVQINPLILAISVSLDTFSVSVSFGMLNLQKQLFILSAGISAFVCSYSALTFLRKMIKLNRKYLNRIVGILLVGLSIWSYLNLN